MRNTLSQKGFVASVVAVIIAFGASAAVAQEKFPPDGVEPCQIIRLSVDFTGDKCVAYTPKPYGVWEKDEKKRVMVDWKTFRDNFATELGKKKASDGPVVVMVHGFMGNPTAAFEPDPQKSENPHDFSFRFSKKNQLQRLHTASWPRGRGLAQVDDTDEGKGLPIAFAWKSTPDVTLSKIRDGFIKNVQNIISKLQEQVTWKDPMKAVALVVQIAATGKDVNDIKRAFNELSKSANRIYLASSAKAYLEELNRVIQILTEAEGAFVRVGKQLGLQEVYAQPYSRAVKAGEVLADTIRNTAQAMPNGRVDLFCHSFGTRVVIEALRHLAKNKDKALKQVGQVILVGGAEYSTRAQEVVKLIRDLQGSLLQVDQGPSFYNFTTQADNVLRILAEKYQPIKDDLNKVDLKETIGRHGLKAKDDRWIDLTLDGDGEGSPYLLNTLLKQRELKFEVNGNNEYKGVNIGVVNHWHYFTEEGNIKLFEEILHNPDKWKVEDLKLQLKELREKGAPK